MMNERLKIKFSLSEIKDCFMSMKIHKKKKKIIRGT